MADTTDKQQVFLDAGIDFHEGVERFMSEELYIQYLCKFLFDGSVEELCFGIELENWDMVQNSALTLCGTASNLSLNRLTKKILELLELVATVSRSKVDSERFKEALEQIMIAYHTACNVIEKVYYEDPLAASQLAENK